MAMELKWIELSEIPRRKGGGGKKYGLASYQIQTLYHSAHDACEVDISRFKSAKVAQSTYLKQVRILGYPIKPVIREGRMFLVKQADQTDKEVDFNC